MTPLVFAAITCAPGAALAQAAPSETEIAQARERFGEARKLEDAGKWGEALDLFQQVGRVKMTPQVRFHVALCQENVGLWVQALEGYALAVSEARGNAPDVVKEASEHLRKLEPTIPTVSLRVQGGAAGDELLLDGRLLPTEPLPIRANPGPHTAEVRRGGAVVARESFALEAKSPRWVDLRVGQPLLPPPPLEPKPLEPKAPDPKAPDPAASAPKVADPPPPPPPPASDGHTQRVLGWSAIGLGAASAVATAVMISLRAGELTDLKSACQKLTNCPRSVEPIVSRGKTDATLVNVFGVIAGLGVASGVVLLVTAPSPGAAAARVTLAPVVSLDGAGVSAHLEF